MGAQQHAHQATTCGAAAAQPHPPPIVLHTVRFFLIWIMTDVSCFLDDEVEVDLLRAIRRPFQDAFIENVKGMDGLPAYNFRRGSYIVVPYRYHMPRKFFKDFAILVTANPSDDEGGYMFAVVNPFDTVVELGLLVDSSPPVPAGQTNLTLFYTDHKKGTVLS